MNDAIKNDATSHQFLPTLWMSFAIFCWGGAYVAARYLLEPPTPGLVSLSPLLLAALRFSIASLFFVFPLMRAILHRQISLKELLVLALLGQLAFTLYYWLQYLGIQNTNASVASLLGVGLIPLFTALLAALFRTEVLTWTIGGALLLGSLGVTLIALQHPFSFALQSGFFLGMLCLVSNTFFFALYTIVSKQWMNTISPVVMTGGTMISGAAGLLLLSVLTPGETRWNTITHLNGIQWMAILFLAVFCSVLAYVAYHVALRTMNASRVTHYFYVEPLITIFFGVVLLHEQMTWQIILGALTIGSSMLLLNTQKRAKSL